MARPRPTSAVSGSHQGSRGLAGSRRQPRVLVVSHPSVVPINQSVFQALAHDGWSVDMVVPNRWRHEYATGLVPAAALPGLSAKMQSRRILLPGQAQRHLYMPGTTKSVLDRARPAVAFLEEETFSLPAFQWGMACWRRGIPFGVQADENLDRKLPVPARAARAWTLRHAAFIAARSPKAAELLVQWGARERHLEVLPHAVPMWKLRPPSRLPGHPFTVGFAGRFVTEKGLDDLVKALGRVGGPVRLLLVGNGPLRDDLASAGGDELTVEIISDIDHDQIPRAYALMDILALPSRTTPTWAEQFGRVLVEAMWCGVPVVGSDSGEIPWVIGATGGGIVFREGDVDALATAIRDLRDDPQQRGSLARAGRDAVERLFSVEAVGRQLALVLRDVAGMSARGAPRPPSPQVAADLVR